MEERLRRMRTLQSFIQARGVGYHREMSSPNTAFTSCSRLSPYLAWGCISMRTVVQTVRAAAGKSMPKVAARSFPVALPLALSFHAKAGKRTADRAACI